MKSFEIYHPDYGTDPVIVKALDADDAVEKFVDEQFDPEGDYQVVRGSTVDFIVREIGKKKYVKISCVGEMIASYSTHKSSYPLTEDFADIIELLESEGVDRESI